MGNGIGGPMRTMPFDSGFHRLSGGGGVNTAVEVLGLVLRFAIWVLIIAAILWVVREILRAVQVSHRSAAPPHSPARAELDMLYARGEIARDDYLGRRADLGGPQPGVAPP